MKKLFISLLLTSLCVTVMFGQNTINKHIFSTKYTINDREYTIITVSISTMGITSWIWFDYDLSSTKYQKIYNYFLKKKGDNSILQIAFDANIAVFTPGLFSTFVKRLNSNDTFYLHIIELESQNNNKKDLISYLDNVIQIYPESVILNEFPKLKTMLENKIIFYKGNSITVLQDELIKQKGSRNFE